MQRLPSLPYVVIDTNLLRRTSVVEAAQKAFEREGIEIMLPWTAAYELTKGDGNNFFASVRSLAALPESVALARHTMTLHFRVERPFQTLVSDVHDRVSTPRLRDALRNLRDGLSPAPEAYAALTDGHAEAASAVRMTDYERIFRAAADGIRQTLTRQERNDVRDALRAGDREPFRASLAQSFLIPGRMHEFVAAAGVPPVRARRLAGMPSLVALTIIAFIANAFRWEILGGLDTTKKPLENDGIDIENVLLALYGRGFQSEDRNAVNMYDDLSALVARIWPGSV